MCTNLRYLNGKKPGWSDRTDSWFMIPMTMIRFVEVPQSSLSGVEGSLPLGITPVSDGEPHVFEDVEPDADLLRRIREA